MLLDGMSFIRSQYCKSFSTYFSPPSHPQTFTHTHTPIVLLLLAAKIEVEGVVVVDFFLFERKEFHVEDSAHWRLRIGGISAKMDIKGGFSPLTAPYIHIHTFYVVEMEEKVRRFHLTKEEEKN